MRISDWSSDVCSSDLVDAADRTGGGGAVVLLAEHPAAGAGAAGGGHAVRGDLRRPAARRRGRAILRQFRIIPDRLCRSRRQPVPLSGARPIRSEEHTSELQSLMRISYAVFCLKNKTKKNTTILQ